MAAWSFEVSGVIPSSLEKHIKPPILADSRNGKSEAGKSDSQFYQEVSCCPVTGQIHSRPMVKHWY